MAKKEAFIILFLIAILASLLISGCLKKETVMICQEPMQLINKKCCVDADDNNICDEDELEPGDVGFVGCGDNVCENTTENCTNCWKDCGACKKIVYIYIPRNFTLTEIKDDLNEIYRDGIKFRKDITALNDISNFFYFSEPTPRYFADFMDVKYKLRYNSRIILLNHISNEYYYVNNSESLFNYINASNWYITYRLSNAEKVMYAERISSGNAKNEYPTQRTGYDKEYRYADWKFRNYTREEIVISKSVNMLDNGMVEAVHASITDYSIKYKSSEYHDIDYDTDEEVFLESFRDIEEKKMTNIYSLSFICARNLVITLYSYDFDHDNYDRITKENIIAQIDKNRAKLISQATTIKSVCDRKYASEVFTYT